MKVFRAIDNLRAENSLVEPHVVTIGNFDGCHLGHKSLIQKTLELAAKQGSIGLGLTFEPHPKFFFNPDEAPAKLFSLSQKIRAFAELGMPRLLIQNFDQDFSLTSALSFYHDYLCRHLNASGIVIGSNFFFGRGRAGNPQFLREQVSEGRLSLEIMAPLIHDQEPISSSRIRRTLVEEGLVDKAWTMLGRPYSLEGEIATGQRIGRQIGFPTANLTRFEQVLPKNGVYAGFVWLQDLASEAEPPLLFPDPCKLLPAVFNIGYRPTLQKDQAVAVEGHILADDPRLSAELTGQRAAFYLCYRLRSEQRFNGADELKSQIAKDIQRAKTLLAPFEKASLSRSAQDSPT